MLILTYLHMCDWRVNSVLIKDLALPGTKELVHVLLMHALLALSSNIISATGSVYHEQGVLRLLKHTLLLQTFCHSSITHADLAFIAA